MSKVILVGFDCSECADRALEYAAEWAESSKHQLIVAHVIQWAPFSFNTEKENEVRQQRREAELERARKEILDPAVSKLRERGLYARGVIRHGHPSETLAEVSNEFGVTNVIVGRTGSSGLKTQLFGGVASSLVQISELPVTVVP